jgi:hypothetical protein
MKLKRLIGLSVFVCFACCLCAMMDGDPPQAEISNGLIRAHLYLPDAENGYYRATRFDWSGVINDLEYKGHHYYGQWYDKYSPTTNDAIMGPVEAFDPMGYDEAKTGEGFVKIGVGLVTKQSDAPYNFATYYPIINGGKWKTEVKADQVEFNQELKTADYGYSYSKTVKLIKDKPIMVLSHTLKNTGKQTISTSVFNHNFLVMDGQPTGPGFNVTLPTVPTETINQRMIDLIKVQDNQLIFLKELGRRNASFKDVTNGTGGEYNIKVDNTLTGAGVKISANQPISKMVFWSAAKTVCPEPYIQIKIAPGQSFNWDITYEYYTTEK